MLLNDGQGVFTDVTAAKLPRDGRNSYDGDLVDLDYDGDLDLLVSGGFGSTYEIYLNDGDGAFVLSSASMFQTKPNGNGLDIEAADFTGDGLLDLYLAGYQHADYLFVGEAEVETSSEDPTDLGYFELRGNSPNPFSNVTMIHYSLSGPSSVTLDVFDISGRNVAAQRHDSRQAGRHAFEFRAADLPSGLYAYRIRAGEEITSGTLLKAK